MFERLIGLGKLSRQAFANLLVKRGKASGTLEDPHVDMDRFQILDTGGSLMSLANVYAEFLRMPRRERSAYVDRILTIAAEPPRPETFADAKEALLPRIRDRAFLGIMSLQIRSHAGSDDCPAFENTTAHLVGSLIVTLVLDTPTSMSMLDDEQFKTWNVSFGEVRAAAEANLLGHTPGSFVEIAPGLWLGDWQGDCYAASRILYPELLQKVTSDPLVCVPNRDTLLLAASDDDDALASLVEFLADAAETESYPISRELFKLEGATLVPFEMPAEHPAHGVYRKLRIGADHGVYAEQKALLEETLQEDVFVASYAAFEHVERGLFSSATWTRGVPSLLPKVDRFILVDLDDGADEPTDLYEAPFHALLEDGLLVQEAGLHPPRFRTLGFPSDELLARVATKLDT